MCTRCHTHGGLHRDDCSYYYRSTEDLLTALQRLFSDPRTDKRSRQSLTTQIHSLNSALPTR